MSNQPYFYARNRHGKIETSELTRYSFGHQISRGFGEKPDGIFAEWLWDGKQLTASNDRYGCFPLYYCCHNNEIYLSSSIRTILALGAPNEFDYPALSVFLRLGFFVGEDTAFKHIKVLPPDASFIWEAGLLTVSGSYTTRKPINISEDDAIDEYIQLFRQSIKRRLPGKDKFLMPLSGGRDSRHIFLELCQLGYQPESTITISRYPPFNNEDIRIASMLSEALSVKHTVLERQNARFMDEQRVLEITNFGGDEHAWFMTSADYLKGKTKVSYDGFAGDTLSESHIGKEQLSELIHAGRYREASEGLLKKWRWMRPDDDILKWGLTPNFLMNISVDCAITRITEELKKHAAVYNPAVSFYFWNRGRRKIALSPYAVHKGIKVYSPFLDHDLYDFLVALPESVVKSQTFHTKTIQRAYPKYAHIPFERNDAPNPNPVAHQEQYMREFSKYSLKNNLLASRLVKGQYLFPRMVASLINKKYCSSLWWLGPPVLLYFMELEKLQKVKVEVSATIETWNKEGQLVLK